MIFASKQPCIQIKGAYCLVILYRLRVEQFKYCNLTDQLEGTMFCSGLVQGTILIVPVCYGGSILTVHYS